MRDTQTQGTLPEIADTQSRRTLLRRSAYGVAAIGLTAFLAACGDEDEEDPVVTGQGAEDPGEDPSINEETGIGEDSEATAEDEGN